ncbi:imidazole glycerol phosphate synthase subunit HisH [Roseomonas aeriglobus]|nr:imidazole glycerol phosphate synthase subunit HisH [Roseomonas aeriglobus]
MTGRTVVVDYGIGNVFSVCNALRAIGGDTVLTSDPNAIRKADRVLLPGVGAFARAMDALQAGGIADALRDFVATERPFMGICIGMQVLMERSTEFGDHPGLGFVAGEVRRVEESGPTGMTRRVPHIGWAGLRYSNEDEAWNDTPLSKLSPESDSVYFVHSYHCNPTNRDELLATTDYDGIEITAAIHRDNIFGVQFHPERSGEVGHKVLGAFLEI